MTKHNSSTWSRFRRNTKTRSGKIPYNFQRLVFDVAVWKSTSEFFIEVIFLKRKSAILLLIKRTIKNLVTSIYTVYIFHLFQYIAKLIVLKTSTNKKKLLFKPAFGL